MGTAVVGIALAGIVALIIRKMIRDKKNGKSIQCGGDCKHCGGPGSYTHLDVYKRQGEKNGGACDGCGVYIQFDTSKYGKSC